MAESLDQNLDCKATPTPMSTDVIEPSSGGNDPLLARRDTFDDAANSDRTFCQRWCGPLSEGSQRAAVLALASTAFGSGILAIPWVFAQLGVFLGIFCMLGAGGISLLSQQLLANASFATELDSYGDIMVRTMGRKAAVFLDAIIFINVFGAVCAYFVFMEQFAPPLFASLGFPTWLHKEGNGAMHITIIFSIFPLTPMCLLRSLAKLRYASLLSVVSLILMALIICSFLPTNMSELLNEKYGPLPDGWWYKPHIKDWQTFPQVISICFYSFCCHQNLFAKYRELATPSAPRVKKVICRAVALEIFIYTSVGLCGFLALGPPCTHELPAKGISCTPLNILASPRIQGPASDVARIAMIVTLLVCIPLNLFAGREILDQRVFKRRPDERSLPGLPSPAGSPDSSPGPATQAPAVEPRAETPLVWHLGVSLSFLYMAALVAIVYAHINVILSILGGGCAVSFMFTLPILATLILFFKSVRTDRGLFVRRGTLGSRSPPGTPQIGRKWMNTRGVIASAVIMSFCILIGYLSAALAVVKIVTGKH